VKGEKRVPRRKMGIRKMGWSRNDEREERNGTNRRYEVGGREWRRCTGECAREGEYISERGAE
jgi:hypothetical protein